MKLEQEKAQKEADIKIRNGEVVSLQKELDALSNSVKQLEVQKAEAQKRLDELDDKVLIFIIAIAFFFQTVRHFDSIMTLEIGCMKSYCL
jgi:peptidoglycan hydrolase CwlO-like protein